MNKKRFLWILEAILFVILAAGCDYFYLQRDFPVDGFTDTLVTALKDEYGITIPDSAEFIRGNIARSLQDPAIYITFTVPEEEVEPMLSSAWEEATGQTTINEVNSDKSWHKHEKRSGRFYVTEPDEDGLVTALFSGDNPRIAWLD